MNSKIQGKGMTLFHFISHTRKRKKIFRKAQGKPMPQGAMNRLAEKLHPAEQRFQIKKIIQESPDTRSYLLSCLSSETPAFFRAGQYLSFTLDIEASTLRRPFSISSSPDRSLSNELEITVKKNDPGFASSYIYEHWIEGDIVKSSGPAGDFYFQPLRDSPYLIFLGGGSGITPFRSLIPDMIDHYRDTKILLFHGAQKTEDFLFLKEFQHWEKKYSDRFCYVPVCSGEDSSWKGERGFFSFSMIQSYFSRFIPDKEAEDGSFFFCGPPAMEAHLRPELESMGVPRKRIRHEPFALNENPDETGHEYRMRVHMNTGVQEIIAPSNETLLVALERAGLNPPSLCRSGTCGWCRCRLIQGEVKGADKETGLRQADKKFSFIHPCSQYPLSDLEIYIPDEPHKQ